jgi:hypothetical protein
MLRGVSNTLTRAGRGTGLEVPLYGKPDKAGYAVDFEFTHDTRAIGVDCFWTYFQHLRDVFWPNSIHKKRENFTA